jgi:hypothetical protein
MKNNMLKSILILLLFIWITLVAFIILIDTRLVQIANKFIEYINEKEMKNAVRKNKD